jgi:hypothetical protein
MSIIELNQQSSTEYLSMKFLEFASVHTDVFAAKQCTFLYFHLFKSDYRQGSDWWTDLLTRLHTSLGTTSKYSAVADLYTLQITTTPAKLFPACCVFSSRSIATASNSGDSSASRAHVVTRYCPTTEISSSQPDFQLSTELDRHLFSACLWSSSYSLGADRIENTGSRSSPNVVMDGCLVMARILLTCLPAVTKQRMILLAIVA